MRKPPRGEFLKAELRTQFGSLKSFELTQGLPEGSASDVLRGRSVAQTERAIAETLKKPLHVLFPGRYERPDPDDSSDNPDNSGASPLAHRLSAGAP